MPSDRRLHPASLVLNLGKVFVDLLIPALVVLFAGRGGTSWEVWLGGFAVISVVLSVAKYISIRFRYEETELVVRTGLFFRTVRHVPYDRIQNLDVRQTLLQRLLGVAQVRVETGAGAEPEAILSVLRLDDVAEMRGRVFQRREIAPQPEMTATPGRELLRLPGGELMLAGLIENRGLILILAAFGAAWESGIAERLLGDGSGVEAWSEGVFRGIWDGITGVAPIPFGRVARFGLILLGVILGIRVLSMVWALIRLYDFRLVLEGEDLRTEYGLFTRVASTIPLRRVQLVTVRAGLLHRLTRRVAVRVTTAGGAVMAGEGTPKHREWLAPILHADRVAALLREVVPGIELGQVAWQPVHPRAVRRVFLHWLIGGVLVAAPASFVIGRSALGLLLIVCAWGLIASRGTVRQMGWGVNELAVFFRRGWVSRYRSVAPFQRIQAVALHESPFDRRSGMAGLSVDTAGTAEAFGLHIAYLPRATADTLYERLAAEAAGTAFKW